MEKPEDDHLTQHPNERFVVHIDLPEERRSLDAHEPVGGEHRAQIDPTRLHQLDSSSSIIVRASRIAAPPGSLLK